MKDGNQTITFKVVADEAEKVAHAITTQSITFVMVGLQVSPKISARDDAIKVYSLLILFTITLIF